MTQPPPMSTIARILEHIYASLHHDNEGLDEHIAALKAALGGAASVEIDPARLVQPNRQGRKLMQAYFKQRGVRITFTGKSA